MQDGLNREAATAVGNAPEAFAAHLRAEHARMVRVIREARLVL
jgi:hypothetical protein